MESTYIAIDLKSFYASVECVERGLDPLTTNLVVADKSRTDKTICLAVSPSLKAYGIPGRPRLFEVVRKVKELNARRGNSGTSFCANELKENPSLALDYLVAVPRMALYIEYSAKIYQIYLKYIAPEDIHIYSIDEVFMDVTSYLNTYQMSAHELARKMIHDVLDGTGITATAGIGTNLYLSKIAMDIYAKHQKPDKDGVRIAALDERTYRETMWEHTPLTDFWRIGRGYEKRLAQVGLYTMGDIARCSVGKETDYYNEELLYRLFGVNAELLIDHAWGWEPCTIADSKEYKPETNSISSGQVLHEPYPYDKPRLVVREMTELLVLDLVDKGLVTDQMVLTIGYDRSNTNYKRPVSVNHYGWKVPVHAHGTENLSSYTSSARLITNAVMQLFDRIADPDLLSRRINITANHVIPESEASVEGYEQLDLFTDYEAIRKQEQELEKEKKMQKAVLEIKKKFGKNAVLKGMNLEEGATAKGRNEQIGGHKA